MIISGGTLTVDAADDGIHAELSLVIGDGEVTLTRSYEGLEAQYIAISGGTIDVTAEDDGLNVSGADTATSTTPPPRTGRWAAARAAEEWARSTGWPWSAAER